MSTLPNNIAHSPAYLTPNLRQSTSSLNIQPDTIIHEDAQFAHQREESSLASTKSERVQSDAPKYEHPPLFVGINLPGEQTGNELPYTDEALVEQSLLNQYDMITSRISTPAYRSRVEALFAETERGVMSAANYQQKQSAKTSSGSMPPPVSPPRPLQSRPMRNENIINPSGTHFAKSPSVDGSASFRSVNSGNSPSIGIDRGSPAPSLFSTSNKFSNPPNGGSSMSSSRPLLESCYTLPYDSFEVPPLKQEDVLLLPGPHIRNVIASTAPWVELDAKNPRIAALSIQVLLREIAYATYCGVTYFIICGPKRRTNVEQYSQAISKLLSSSPPYIHLLIHLPFAEEDYISSRTGERVPPADYLSIWEVWNTIRTINNYASNLSVVLQVPSKCNFPPVVASRWYAEPVRMLMLSSTVFVDNVKGYPVLPKMTQSLLFQFFKKNPFIVLSDVNDHEVQGGSISYLLYVRHLLKIQPKPSPIEIYSEGHHDVLQLPLQPLADNLESSTYEVFERDTVKYAQYEKAIYKALQSINRPYIYVAVVGAGRGPLVDRVLVAANALGKNIHVFAIEKNENAYIHLTRRTQYAWAGRNVEVIRTDMRDWQPSVRLSIIVSELLGSFGDNELSPECLDGLEAKNILENDGIMIPQSYTGYFTPAMSPTLYTNTCNFKVSASAGSGVNQSGRPGGSGSGSAGSARGSELNGSLVGNNNPNLQTPFVVMLDAVDYLAPNQYAQAWSFSHPNPLPVIPGSNLHNTRKIKHTFVAASQGTLHGIAGYFEATLFRDVQLSTRPDTIDAKSKDMLSWFPMWFPLSTPLHVTEGSEIDISMWRLTDNKRMWYEWTVETFVKVSTALQSSSSASKNRIRIRTNVSAIHNSNGHCFSVPLYN
ncbi:similar to Saccharomyces cerevisiae YBR133C HSL7 Protein arginine N-methyltransferase that exhibits septin and Hsl1p-dependent bud neck localization and periodic Hsl1p-dependent phosphorylation [Geotrichum candidum]|uniref:Similar to Saccharomyces cerevisiae YBR133C HSL7 Protein arginine N-methyltransferase that exhibits septin and Hsl1p-dependent bud neck localization and periodic Hsl1p-dependent phosphorylation n=1 Tax=Geotrichum candidum TaxID=1173061 RepID=A0A0J9XFU3_GEOCN|nr:similar to Saccharomyces cerevisiae YBR133C HSL7 Protein arginine N-methyltransferase that exhibits septin and Hsl1p-dependent bud neck localization and periodic Hsl1p-dependent phosphorylation [Geotrichum candidum]